MEISDIKPEDLFEILELYPKLSSITRKHYYIEFIYDKTIYAYHNGVFYINISKRHPSLSCDCCWVIVNNISIIFNDDKY